MALKKIGKVLAGIAPIAASVVSGGLLGPVAAGVAKQVTSALNLPDGASEEDIEAAVVKADPSQLAELRRIDATLQKDLAEIQYKTDELGIREEEVHAKDRDSARHRQVELHDNTPTVLAWVAIIGFFALLFLMWFRPPPEGSEEVLFVAVGILGSLVHSIKDFFFGSSKSSQDKDDVIRAAINGRK